LSQVTLKQLLEAGVHFGHQTKRWNPKMKRFIFGERNGIYIINLEETLACLERALDFIKKTASEGKDILWVGTKTQAKEAVREAAQQCGMPFVTERWLGGMLTNFETVRKSIQRLDAIDQMEKDGSFQFFTKKEVSQLKTEREKLDKNLVGVRNMKKIPAALFVIDSKKEEIAVKEAVKLGIPVAAVLDTNCDPDMADFPIPGNDDAIRAVKLFCETVSQTIQEGRKEFEKFVAEEKAREAEAEALAAEAAAREEAEKASAAAGTDVQLEIGEELIEPPIVEKFAKQFTVRESEKDKALKARPKKTPRKE
jgi:small subunit ribosomal protein S2